MSWPSYSIATETAALRLIRALHWTAFANLSDLSDLSVSEVVVRVKVLSVGTAAAGAFTVSNINSAEVAGQLLL